MKHNATYGLIGHPLGHSFSQRYFSEKFRRERINAEYLNFDIASIESLPEIIADNPFLKGFNVTIPYKQTILPYLSSVSPEASEIGAVNVVKIIRTNGKPHLLGFNTDIIGFRESIRPFLRPNHKKALVLGTGGASRAVVAALRQLGINPVCVSRTPSEDQLSYHRLGHDIISEHTVIINATPLGTFPDIDNCPDIPYDFLTPEHLCFDLVYNPPVTKFMAKAEANGSTAVNGAQMLQLQAEAAWEIWTAPKF